MCDPGPETELRRAAVRISDSRGLLLDAKWDTAIVVAGRFQFDAPKVTVSQWLLATGQRRLRSHETVHTLTRWRCVCRTF